MGGKEVYIKYNREQALKSYYKHQEEHLNDPKPEPKPRGRPKIVKPEKIPMKRGRPRKSPSSVQSEKPPKPPRERKVSIETLEDIKERVKQGEIKQALSVLLKYL